jgi:DNA mismatch repair protein MutL
MGKINVLSFEVANLIAAGEVVDRPASVIKELVENSIDAGADRITVEIQRGGVLFMRVSDNGSGIEPDDLPIAVRRHATSKIKDANDLDAIMTLGFRGEALAAICSVADVRIISKTRGRELGAYIEIHSGRASAVSERGASEGTTIIVENLFANVPARLKFLKRDVTEGMAVCSVLEKIALSHPEIAFKLISDGAVKLDTSGDGNRRSAIRCVYGKDIAKNMIEIEGERDGVRVTGYITAPASPRANRNYQNFFINGRYIKTKTGMAAIEQAYTSYIPPEKFPGCVIYIDIAPNAVDVNVHPGKLEVKFSNERPVFDAIYHSVRTALAENTARPEINDLEGRKASFTSTNAWKPSANLVFAPVIEILPYSSPIFSAKMGHFSLKYFLAANLNARSSIFVGSG